LEEQNEFCIQKIDVMSELDSLVEIFSSLFGKYEFSEHFDNITNSYFTILLII
jgi:hypothetical protein